MFKGINIEWISMSKYIDDYIGDIDDMSIYISSNIKAPVQWKLYNVHWTL